MEGADLLLVGAEVSVAFAGFAGIIAAFKFKDEHQISRGNYEGLSIIVNFGLGGAFFCLLPLVLSLFGIADTKTWSISSLIFGFFLSYHFYNLLKGARASNMKPKTKSFFSAVFALSAVCVISMFANSAGVIFAQEPGPYVATIMFGLGLVGLMFSRLLLKPLRRSIQPHIAEKK